MKVLQKKYEAKPAVFLNVKPTRERERGSDMTNKKAKKKPPKLLTKRLFFGDFVCYRTVMSCFLTHK